MTYDNDNKFYMFDAGRMRSLEQIRLRLYAPPSLNGDERRDLANKLDALMHDAAECELDEELRVSRWK